MKTDSVPLILILAAAGSSSRMGLGKKKEYLALGSGTVLSQAAAAFLTAAPFELVLVTVPQGGQQEAEAALRCDASMEPLLARTQLRFVEGGATRQQSVYRALQYAQQTLPAKTTDTALVLIHDAARPFVSQAVIGATISAAQEYGAAVPAVPAIDTQKECTEDNTIARHLCRSRIAAVQTPQGFLFAPLLRCHQAAAGQQQEYTDDTEIWDTFPRFTGGRKVHIVAGDRRNKKITYREDVMGSMMHIGLGTDLHRLVPGRKFMLGGVEIPAEKGELGHSDGDVLLHAVTDALLGASGLGDIGSYFPPEDAQWKDADSAALLRKVWADVRAAGWELVNMDCVVELERPKFLPWRNAVIASIARILNVQQEQVFVKAKTNEKLGEVGSGDAVKAYCSCLLQRQTAAIPAPEHA